MVTLVLAVNKNYIFIYHPFTYDQQYYGKRDLMPQSTILE